MMGGMSTDRPPADDAAGAAAPPPPPTAPGADRPGATPAAPPSSPPAAQPTAQTAAQPAARPAGPVIGTPPGVGTGTGDGSGAAPARPAPAAETVEWGGDERPRRPAPPWLTGLRSDRRIPLVAAGLGAVALALSVLSEWQVTTLADPLFGGEPEEAERRTMTTGLADLGGWAGGYLAGAVVLVGAVTLLLFGPRPGRAYARLVAVSTGAVLAVLLVGLIGELADTTFALPDWVVLQTEENQLAVARGRGGWCALVGVLILAGAAWLAKVPADRAATPTAGPAAAADDDEHPDDWPWRRPGAASPDPDDELPGPLDLSVGPAAPFTALPGDRDARDDRDNGRSPWRGEGR
jgi:hypothetical protein